MKKTLELLTQKFNESNPHKYSPGRKCHSIPDQISAALYLLHTKAVSDTAVTIDNEDIQTIEAEDIGVELF